MLKMGEKKQSPPRPQCMLASSNYGSHDLLVTAVRCNHRELHVWVTRSHGELVAGLEAVTG